MSEFYLVITNPDVDEEGLEAEMLQFCEELQQQPGVNRVSSVTEADVPDGAKGIGKAIAGFLELDIAAEMAGDVITALRDMAMGRGIKIVKEKANGAKLSVEVGNRQDLDAVKDFLDSLD